MKSIILMCFLAMVGLAAARPSEEHYTDKYDDVDLDQVLGNKRLLSPYVLCALDKGKCAPDAKELKDHIQEALENECAKCNEKQKDGTRRVIKHLINNEPEFWKELSDKYDPDAKFTHRYEKELKEVTA